MRSANIRDSRAEAANIDRRTVEGFGEEWAAFDQFELDADEHRRLFDAYFSIFDFGGLPERAEGFDLGCGSGRWAVLAAPRVGKLHCIDPADLALAVARRRMGHLDNVEFHLASADTIPLADESQDFGYSLGVLHHIPDTEAALRDCVAKLKPGAPFLVYLYYAFDNQPGWYRQVWRTSDLLRRGIARLPFPVRRSVTSTIAGLVYWPLARTARWGERAGANIRSWPLSGYRNCSFYTMRTDALDRFGTRLEQRFSKRAIADMMARCGLVNIRFSEAVPYWVACGRKGTRPEK